MQIHAQCDLVARYAGGAGCANASNRAVILILKLVIHKHVQGASERTAQIHTREPVVVDLRAEADPTANPSFREYPAFHSA